MIKDPVRRVIKILSDGQYHSGEVIGKDLGITRGAVWKIIQRLRRLGFDVKRIPGVGYCFDKKLILYDKALIFSRSYEDFKRFNNINNIEILDSVDSTNTYLLEKVKQGVANAHCVLAEHQTKGRGRRGRNWYSPYGKNIYMSLLWKFDQGPMALSGLSLAVGCAIQKALLYGYRIKTQLKWPNDVYYQGKKLAGILIESFVDDMGVCHAVIGIGVNVHLPSSSINHIDQQTIDLQTIDGGTVNKNSIAGSILRHLLTDLPLFTESGFKAFMPRWQECDFLRGKQVLVSVNNEQYTAMAKGVDENGCLMVQEIDQAQVKRLHSGEVSIKPTA